MPRKKKVTEGAIPEVAENKQTKAQLEETSSDSLYVVEKTEETGKASVEKKLGTRKDTVKKEAEGKGTAAKKSFVKKDTAKKEDSQEKQIFIQYADKEVTIATIEERVKKVWEAEGHRVSSIKKLDIYIKPTDSAAYYVINGKNAGRVDF